MPLGHRLLPSGQQPLCPPVRVTGALYLPPWAQSQAGHWDPRVPRPLLGIPSDLTMALWKGRAEGTWVRRPETRGAPHALFPHRGFSTALKRFLQVWLPSVALFFFFFFLINVCMYLFIYSWLHWVFVAERRLPLDAASGGYSSLQCAGFSLRWLLLLRSTGSRHAGFSSCGTRAQ